MSVLQEPDGKQKRRRSNAEQENFIKAGHSVEKREGIKHNNDNLDIDKDKNKNKDKDKDKDHGVDITDILKKTHIIDNMNYLDPSGALKNIGEIARRSLPYNNNSENAEFGPTGLTRKLFGENSEFMHPETRLTKSQMEELYLRGFSDGTSGDVNSLSWRLKRRDAYTFDTAENKGINIKIIAQALDAKNEEKTLWWTNMLTNGVMDPICLASAILDDDLGVHKGPMILPLLSFVLADVTKELESTKRVYKVFLEYGIGSRCLRWSVSKTSEDFENLHNRLTNFVRETFEKTFRKNHIILPSFPKLHREYDSRDRDRDSIWKGSFGKHLTERPPTAQNSDNSVSARPKIGLRSTSERSNRHIGKLSALPFVKKQARSTAKDNEEFRAAIQNYLATVVKLVTFREPALRVFQFFEMSPFSMLLNNEIAHKRKEGTLYIMTTAKKQGWRVGHLKFHDLAEMVDRHTNKWVILGDSFLMYTSDISSTTPLDVFLFDFSFQSKLTMLSDVKQKDDFFEASKAKKNAFTHFSGRIKLVNGERKLKLGSTQSDTISKWKECIDKAASSSEWSKEHRFGSFAPVRSSAFAQWFVDGRDYMYAASSAIEMATDVIYIHDWWLSPELYLRRPANGNQDWRIDRLLKRKAQQGVKIFIIIYRNVANTVVTDSLYTKHSLLDLNNNIYVLRSPNQLMQNVYFWAHHEKLLIVDNTIAFLGGCDLCYGRWDTPDHVLIDDQKYNYENEEKYSEVEKSNEKHKGDSNVSQKSSAASHSMIKDEKTDSAFNIHQYHLFPGKDYSNPRTGDFFNLTSPNEDMYDRHVIPRMPWHDIQMVTSGQVARDLARHFVQRWNYLIRQKRPSRPTPLLVPPRPFTPEELKDMKLTGTCEVQLLRSAGDWSLGLSQTEKSIHEAYIKCIETSEHFVYIENQFFVSSCFCNGTEVKNSIGDALVDRIIEAHKRSESWKAIIVIPLMPGFEANVDTKEGGSVRLIMQLQYMTISMGEHSIFAKLKRVGIDPEEYIQFFSLRKWGMIGPKKVLTTEQLYVHAKCMIVDDRIAIIGSANINERSMRGNRDSEVAAIVRDRDMIDSTMDGKKYKVGRFAHTLRMRLMREHLGVDVDLLDLVERRFMEIERFAKTKTGKQAAVFDEGDITLSAMVELGTRYLLDLWQGTVEYNDLNKENTPSAEQLKNDLLSSFQQIANESANKDLDDIEFECSFNHRVGVANKGLRDNKTFSSDNRVATKDHREDVMGVGQDGFNTISFVDSKLRLNKFLKEYIKQMESPESVSKSSDTQLSGVLPTYEDIVEILSQKRVENEGNDELNLLRWKMIKRLFYIRKLYSKDIHDSMMSKCKSQAADEAGETKVTDESPVTLDLPAAKLSDSEIDNLEQSILPQTVSSFIDPWSFDDPLGIDFNEGTWLVQALRNTLIYQMVFHCQPDDAVQTWRDYTEYENMRKAFNEHQYRSRGTSALYDDDDEFLFTAASEDDYLANDDEANNFEEELTDNTEFEQSERVRRRHQRRQKLAELKRYQIEVLRFRNSGINNKTVYDYETAKKLLAKIRGNVVQFPTRWLKREVEGANWFYKADMIPPIQIYD